ncbi:MAG TPA: efflux RND transporter permease subunit [Thermoanaerobaculia bacterium]|jgi:HAE1 family hydrophobic/amphiphilic exporter-1|nr:efflux RND transporter permease subunit [Thermoanaerobaculia bacterium]
MQKLAEICIRRPVFAAMIILALVVVGAASYGRLGVDRFPTVDLPTVSVRTNLPGASTEETEAEVSQKIEEAVNTVEGIQELRSVSSGGSSFVIATFDLSRDIDTAAQDIRDRVSTVIRNLPEDTLPPTIAKFNNDSSPVMSVALSGNRSLRELTEYADKVVKVQLERSAGVGEVQLVGGLERAINVWMDPDRLAAYGIPITAVRDALVRQNSEAPGGNVTSGGREQTLRTMGRFESSADFNDLVVATINGQPVRVRDLGESEDGTKEQRSVARLNGVPTVTLEVRRQSGANTIEVIEGVKQALTRVEAQLPPDLKIETIRDQSRYIYAALHEINLHLILGSIFASLVVMAFMRSWRSTVIAAVAIPCSVIATFGMMKALDFTLNSVTMLALVLMVGVVIDDAIVVLENIFRFIEEKKMKPFEAARAATQEIGLAVLATTLSLVVIFVPVSFMSSISGRFLYQFGLTAAAAVLVSLLVSFTLTPMMSARMLRAEDAASSHGGHENDHAPAANAGARSRSGFYARIDHTYERLLRATMKRRRLAAAIALGVMLASIPIYNLVKVEYIPSDVDESEFEVSVNAPEGTSLAGIDEAMRAIEGELRQVKGVRTVLATAGGGFLGGVNQGNVFVRIAPHEERKFSIPRFFRGLFHLDPLGAFRGNYSQRDVMTQVRKRLSKFKELRTGVRNITAFNIGGGNWDIDFALRGPDLQALARYAEQLRDKSKELGGIVDADTTLKLDKPELRVVVDRERAAALGVDMSDVANALRLMVGGDQEVSRFRDPGVNDDYDVQLRLAEGARNDPQAILQLYVPGGGGKLVQLGNFVTVKEETTASRVDRLDRQRQVSLRAGVAPGYALADRLAALQKAVDEMNLPPTYSTAVGGRGRELARTYREFVWALLLSIIFMYMILASQFESVVHPLTILLSLPLAVPFALISLWATGNTLNLYSALGVLVLFGVVKKNAILQIDHMNGLRRAGMDRAAAIIQANRDRLRPILMTTLALVAGMLPLALGTGPGSEERRAIAVVVIGGQTLSLLLTLLATPVFYSLFDDLRGTERVGGIVRRFWPRPKREKSLEEAA